jgi:uncharacterized damage-inducible protein DinB
MTYEDIKNLLDYHYWARDRILEAVEAISDAEFIQELGNSFPSIRDTLVHIFAAELIWYMRLRGISPRSLLAPKTIGSAAALRRSWKALEQDLRRFVRASGDDVTSEIIDYKMRNGNRERSSVRDIIMHIVNHGSYHRGQVVTMLRQLGAKPPQSMDLIEYCRVSEAAWREQTCAMLSPASRCTAKRTSTVCGRK